MQAIELKERLLDYRSKEAFKMLRTNIDFTGGDLKVICITSCTPNEGKSNISFEVAQSYAQMGKKVLLVDADLRKSVMRQRHKKGLNKHPPLLLSPRSPPRPAAGQQRRRRQRAHRSLAAAR